MLPVVRLALDTSPSRAHLYHGGRRGEDGREHRVLPGGVEYVRVCGVN